MCVTVAQVGPAACTTHAAPALCCCVRKLHHASVQHTAPCIQTVPTRATPGLLKDACGLPFSCILEPLAVPADGLPLYAATGPAPLPLLARCRHCYAYINRYCELSGGGFECSLCGKATALGGGGVAARYLKQPMARDILPELACSVYEVDVGDADDSAAAAAAASSSAQDAWAEGAAAGGGGGGGAAGGVPAFLAVVDAAGDDEFLELVGRGRSLMQRPGSKSLPRCCARGRSTGVGRRGQLDWMCRRHHAQRRRMNRRRKLGGRSAAGRA